MKAISILKRATALTVATVLMSVYALSANTSAITYTSTHPGTNYPAFNVFTGVPVEGNEADFLRGKEETKAGASTTNVQSDCSDGTRFTIRVYVHNAANQTLNNGGNGPGVAKGTKVRVALPSQTSASNFNLNSVISATNATSVSDGMSINCGGKNVELDYVKGSAKQFTGYTGTKSLSDSIVTSGAPVGTKEPNGDVWGCFAQRVWVTLTVVVKEKPTTPETPPTTPPETPPTTPPATPTTSVTPPAPGQPAQPGQPVPTMLPVTGAAGVIATFLGVSSLSSVLYYIVVRRFSLV